MILHSKGPMVDLVISVDLSLMAWLLSAPSFSVTSLFPEILLHLTYHPQFRPLLILLLNFRAFLQLSVQEPRVSSLRSAHHSPSC